MTRVSLFCGVPPYCCTYGCQKTSVIKVETEKGEYEVCEECLGELFEHFDRYKKNYEKEQNNDD